MTQELQHPKPPPKLVGDWLTEAADLHLLIPSNLDYLATRAAQWGADQELEQCLRYAGDNGLSITRMRATRRPKPPSLKEQALQLLETYNTSGVMLTADQADTIRLALEALND
jgi:hypothetical protein